MAEKLKVKEKPPISNRSAYWPPEERPSNKSFTDGYHDYIFNPSELNRYERDSNHSYLNDNAYRIVNDRAPGAVKPDLRIEYGPRSARKTLLVPYGEQIPEKLVFSQMEGSDFNYDNPLGEPWEEAKWEYVDKNGNVLKNGIREAFKLNPELRYIGPIDDLKLSGAIRGTFGFGGEAFFNKGSPAEGYRDPARTNYYIETTPDYLLRASEWETGMDAFTDDAKMEKLSTNPLYKPGSSHPRGAYRTLNPKKIAETNFIDRINPNNKKGMKIVRVIGDGLPVEYRAMPKEARASVEVEDPKLYPKYVTQPKEKVIYDGITPFKERTLGQHYRNAKFNAQSVLIQPEVKAAARYLGEVGSGAAKIGLTGAGLAGYAGAVYEKGPLAAVEFGIPFTPLKMGIGPINTLDAPEKAPYHLTKEYADKVNEDSSKSFEMLWQQERERPQNPAFNRKPADFSEFNFNSTLLEEFKKEFIK